MPLQVNGTPAQRTAIQAMPNASNARRAIGSPYSCTKCPASSTFMGSGQPRIVLRNSCITGSPYVYTSLGTVLQVVLNSILLRRSCCQVFG